jgi:hypothetical protein
MQERGEHEHRAQERRDLARHCKATERLERLVVGDEQRSVADGGREAAQHDRAGHALDGSAHVATQQTRSIVDVEWIFAADSERDGQCHEVQEVETQVGIGRNSYHPEHAHEERGEHRRGTA